MRRAGKGCLGLLLVLLAVAVGIAFVQGRRTPVGPSSYVAMGSSFAAGAGLGALEPGSPWLCARSVGGYPHRLARQFGLHLTDRACGGDRGPCPRRRAILPTAAARHDRARHPPGDADCRRQ